MRFPPEFLLQLSKEAVKDGLGLKNLRFCRWLSLEAGTMDPYVFFPLSNRNP